MGARGASIARASVCPRASQSRESFEHESIAPRAFGVVTQGELPRRERKAEDASHREGQDALPT